MIRIEVTVDTDVLEAISETAVTAPKRMQQAFNRATASIRAQLYRDLTKEPPRPSYPIRWKSEKQRRAFFATNGFGRGIPTKRSGRYLKGWRVLYTPVNAYIGTLTAENNVPYAKFISGDDAQPFHLDTGWTQAAPVLADYRQRATELLIDTWYRVSTNGKAK